MTNHGAAAGALITGSDNTNTTFTGILQDGSALSLIKVGTGTLTLGAASTYTGGTILLAGVLVIANAAALGRGNVTVNGGALKASGAAMNIQVGGNYQQTGGELDLRIGGTTTGAFDRLTVAGGAALAGRLSVSSINGFVPKNGERPGGDYRQRRRYRTLPASGGQSLERSVG